MDKILKNKCSYINHKCSYINHKCMYMCYLYDVNSGTAPISHPIFFIKYSEAKNYAINHSYIKQYYT